MADPVNSPLLSVAPVEPAAAKNVKAGNSAAKSGESGDFSRVLDGQRARDASAQRSAGEAPSTANAADTAGKALPSQGNEAADPANRGTAPASDMTAPATEDGIAEAENMLPGTSSSVLLDGEPANAAAGTSQFSASFDDSLAVGSRAFPGVAVDAKAQPESTPLSVSQAAAKPAELMPLGTPAQPNTAALANSAVNSRTPTQAAAPSATDGTALDPENLPGVARDKAFNPGGAAGAVPGASATTSDPENLFGVARDKAFNPGGAAGAVPGASATTTTATSGVSSDAIASSTVPAAVASAAEDADLLASQVTSPGAVKGSDAQAKSPVTGEVISKGLGANAGERASSMPLDTQALNRSTADWLRSGMGSQAAGQRALAEMQVDSGAELTRGLASAQRADGAAPAPAAASTIAGLAPASTAGSAALPAASVAASAMPQYSLGRAPDDVEFPSELTARMKTLVRDGVREARLQLHPAELGRLQVTVTTEGDQTKVAFTAETVAARDAIEQSMPRLREMLEQSGLQLAQSDVGQGDLQGNGERGADGLFAEPQSGPEAADVDSPVLVSSVSGNSRIDTYI